MVNLFIYFGGRGVASEVILGFGFVQDEQMSKKLKINILFSAWKYKQKHP